MARPMPMTPGRWAALAVGAPLALALIGFTGFSLVAAVGQASYRVSLNLPTSGGKPVSLELTSGDVNVGPAPGSQVLVRGVAHYSLFKSKVTWHHTSTSAGTGLSVNTACRQITGTCSFNLNVGLPVTATARIAADSGNMTVHDLPGRLTLQSHYGDMTVARLSGLVDISGNSGNITGQQLSGTPLKLSQNSGDITVTGLSSGDVSAQDFSGNVLLKFSKIPSHVVVSNKSGDITVVLPAGPTAYQVQASSRSGSTNIDVPTSPSSPHVITVTVQSGNITVTH